MIKLLQLFVPIQNDDPEVLRISVSDLLSKEMVRFSQNRKNLQIPQSCSKHSKYSKDWDQRFMVYGNGGWPKVQQENMKYYAFLAEWFVSWLEFAYSTEFVTWKTTGIQRRVGFAQLSILDWIFTQFNTTCIEMNLSKL